MGNGGKDEQKIIWVSFKKITACVLVVILSVIPIGITVYSAPQYGNDFSPNIISAGNFVSMVIKSDGSLWAWG